ncbi:hypothetical protein EX30DRAFT_50137 [Ascodesmis nigricans]|uniref:Tc1-like transposase DDE domain-containing protein n=1 Tax=Ascodesmis nigricans TaxID=341454 RepID=A0A4S2MW28_9PEZI|nr:hypothetical protein EX30DRAFT_50137 [Ascodesmis nigricans]
MSSVFGPSKQRVHHLSPPNASLNPCAHHPTATPSDRQLEDINTVTGVGYPVASPTSSSPDLNPIENLWRIIKQRIKARKEFPNTVPKMNEALQDEWDRLEPRDFNPFIDSMPMRIAEVLKRDGQAASY